MVFWIQVGMWCLVALTIFVKFYCFYKDNEEQLKRKGQPRLCVLVMTDQQLVNGDAPIACPALVLVTTERYANRPQPFEEVRNVAVEIDRLCSLPDDTFRGESQLANFIQHVKELPTRRKPGLLVVPRELDQGIPMRIGRVDLTNMNLHPGWREHYLIACGLIGDKRLRELNWQDAKVQKMYNEALQIETQVAETA